MSSVDDRIVNMEFNNKQFTQGVNQTERDLSGLEKTLARTGKSEGLTKMGSAAQVVSTKFSALQVAGVAAVATIASKATLFAGKMIKSFTLDPIMQGFQEYQTNLNSVQTIMSNTGKSVGVVNKYLDQLNTYADQTVYNFAEMARNIGTFTAAGVKIDTATASIKGIANLAALSGSNSQQASTAMYQLSQAIAAGRVGLQDWNSVVNAGMGGKVFQTALARTAENMGTLEKGAAKLNKTTGMLTINGEAFRQTISAVGGKDPWLTGQVLTDTLAQISGEFDRAELKEKGFSDAAIKDILKLQRTAFDAATKIKTFPQLLGVIKESIGSTFAGAFRTIIGDFNQSKKLWGDVGFAIIGPSGFLTKIQNGFDQTLTRWAKLGGRTNLLDGLGNAFKALGAVVAVFRDAFTEIFPPATGRSLFQMTLAFRQFTETLMPSKETLANLSSIFKGFFAAISIGWQIVKGFAGVIGDLFGILAGGAGGGFLEFAAGIGDMIVAFDQALKSGDGLENFFDGLTSVLAVPLKLINAVAEAIYGIFGGFDEAAASMVEGSIDRVGQRLSPLAEFGARAKDALTHIFDGISSIIGPVIDAFSNLGEAIGESISTGGFDAVFDVINTGLLGGILLLLRQFFKNGLNLNLGVGGSGGLFESITESFGALTGTMEAMQTKLKADALLRIAGAIGIMTLSVVALSLIDSRKLTSALTAMAVGFGLMIGAMAAIEKLSVSAVKMPFIAAAMVLMASAMLILSGAIAVLAALSWEELSRGLAGIAGALTAIAIGMRLMPKGMVAQSAALVGLAFAINGIALAIKSLAGLSWEEIAKGLGAIAGALIGIAVAMRLMPKGILLQAAALLILSGALNAMANAIAMMGNLSWEQIGKGAAGLAGALALIAIAMRLMPKGMVLQAAALAILSYALQGIGKAMQKLGSMSWESIGKGLVGIAGALVLIAGAMQLMPVSMPLTAAGLVLVSIALGGISEAVMAMSGMSWEEIAKGLVALGGALAVIAGGLYLMSGAVAGAAALLLTAVALNILVPALAALGSLSIETIVKALASLAAAFLVLGAAGYFLGPSILLLGAGVALLGAGLALAGAGMLAFSTGLAMLVAIGAAGIGVMIGAIDAFLDMIPLIAVNMAQGFVKFIQVIGQNAPKLRKAFDQIFSSMLGVVEDAIPHMASLLSTLIDAGLGVLEKGIPRYAEAGMNIIIGVLRAAEKKVPEVVDVAGDLIVAFIREMGRNVVKLANAGADMIVDVLNGLSDAVENKGDEIRAAARNLARTFIDELGEALREMMPSVPIPDLPSPKGIAKGFINNALPGNPAGRVAADSGGGFGRRAATKGDMLRGKKPPVDPAIASLNKFNKTFAASLKQLGVVLESASQLLVGASSGRALQMARSATGLQTSATVASTRADIQDRLATRAQDKADARLSKAQDLKKKKGESDAHFKARKKRAGKDARADKKAANQATKLAERTAARAARIQEQADAARQKAIDEAAVEQATKQGDFAQVGDIRSQQGQDLAKQAQDLMAQAQAKALEAGRVAKTNSAQAKKLRQQAANDAKAAAALAKQANTAEAAAIAAYGEARRLAAKSVIERMNEIRQQQVDEEKQRKWEQDYEAASTDGKIAMLQTRINENNKRASDARDALNKAYAESDALAARIAAGGAVSEEDIAAVNKALEEAEKQSQIASEAANQAQQDADTIEQLQQEQAQDNASGGSSSGGGQITPSRTALEDAALAVDRYTTSVAQAEEAAMAGASAPQFVQNNYSPDALSASEIYRNSKNLLSAAEIKMGVPTG